jgi:hypothetical protein
VCVDNPNAPRDADGDPHLCQSSCDPKNFTIQCNGDDAIAFCDKDGRVQNKKCAGNERCGFPGICWPLLPDQTRCNGTGQNSEPVCQNDKEYGYCDWNGIWRVRSCGEGAECIIVGGGLAGCRPTTPRSSAISAVSE